MAGRRLFVIAAPSGAGKTSLVRELLVREPNLRVCVSHTTRAQRPTEIDGRDYHFVTVPQFEALLAGQEFLEHALVFNHYYGTSRTALTEAFGRGHDVILEIDWQGAAKVRLKMPDCIHIFILPPTRNALAQRLRARGTDTDKEIQKRLIEAVSDITHYKEFDYVLINDVFTQAVADLQRILECNAANLRPNRPELLPLLQSLLA